MYFPCQDNFTLEDDAMSNTMSNWHRFRLWTFKKLTALNKWCERNGIFQELARIIIKAVAWLIFHELFKK